MTYLDTISIKTYLKYLLCKKSKPLKKRCMSPFRVNRTSKNQKRTIIPVAELNQFSKKWIHRPMT